MFDKSIFLQKCHTLLDAYKEGKLGYMKMPEDENPGFLDKEVEKRFVYFTLPMALNYQRNSYTLRENVLKTYNDKKTNYIFDIKNSATISEEILREILLKYKIALQPNKHINTWITISKTIFSNRGSITNLFQSMDNDFLKIQKTIQKDFKSGFPYLSGPKIFHYWSFIMGKYGKIDLKNSEYIEIAPDTHITKCSVKLGIINQIEADNLSKELISSRRSEVLQGTGINPIDMHAPLWFRSRNNFIFEL